jgi:hypothetical protein
VHSAGAQTRKNLLGGEMLIGRKEERGNLHALSRRPDPASDQLL